MPTDLGQVDWLYVSVRAVFAFAANVVANLLSFKRRGIKRASPAREARVLTMRPRSPAARNAFRNQISSLVKSMVIKRFERERQKKSNGLCRML